MRNLEFMILLSSSANKTSNVRVYSNWWNYSSILQIPDKISSKCGGMINLLQAQIDKGLLCKKDEYLLIYNFQPLQTVNGIDYYNLNMIIKPYSKITETNVNKGQPLRLVMNANTGIIMNEAMAMLEMQLNTEEELAEEIEDLPIYYGNYNHYLTSGNESIHNTLDGSYMEKNQILLSVTPSQLTNNNLPVINSPFPNFNNTMIYQEKLRQTFLSPARIFAGWLESFDETKTIRTEYTNSPFNNNLKKLLKHHFTEAISAIWNKIFDLPPAKISEKSLNLLKEKKLEILYIMREVYTYLIWNRKEVIEDLSCLHNLYLYFGIETGNNNKDIFNQDLKEHLNFFVDKHFKIKGKDLIFELTFEKIFYNIFIDVNENLFSDYKFNLINAIVKNHVNLDYVNPAGEEEYRTIMAKALNVWYNIDDINSKNILFISAIPIAFLSNIIEKRICIAKDEIIGKIKNKWTANLLKKYLDDIIRNNLVTNPNHFIIIDESYIERYVDETLPLDKRSLMNLLLKDFRDRIILIRSSMGIFSSEQESISAIITFNETLMEKLLSESVNMQAHAPKNLQYAYAHTIEDFIKIMFSRDQNSRNFIEHINALRGSFFDIKQQNCEQEKQQCVNSKIEKEKNLKRSIDEINSSSPGMLTQFNYHNEITKKPKIIRIIGESFTEIKDPSHTNLTIGFKN